MSSKKTAADLSGLVSTKGAAAPLKAQAQAARSAEPAARIKGDSEPLNFRVPAEFRRRFKMFAAENDMKLNELLFKSFDEYAQRHH